MNKIKNMKCKNSKGVTLMALVITIVVLIILVAVVINMFLGENGIIRRSKDAVNVTKGEEIKNKIQIALAAQIKSLDNHAKLSDFQEELNNQFGSKNAIATDNKDDTFIVDIDNENIEYIVKLDGELIEVTYDKWDGKSSTEPITISKEIHINKASELKWLADKVNSGSTFDGYTIYLDNNLDFGARGKNDNWETPENELIAWTAIGKSATNMLSANFEGNNHLIKGIYI